MLRATEEWASLAVYHILSSVFGRVSKDTEDFSCDVLVMLSIRFAETSLKKKDSAAKSNEYSYYFIEWKWAFHPVVQAVFQKCCFAEQENNNPPSSMK